VPTVFSHPAIALTATWFRDLPRRVIVAGAVVSILPDGDVAAFALGIPYAHPFGHRGFTHSIVFALLIASITTLLVSRTRTAFVFLFLCAMSHGLLDAMTTGGLGIAFFAPFDNTRHFLPWRPIRVSPIGARFFSTRGLAVVMSEVVWVWVPCAVVGLAGYLKNVRHVEREVGKQR